MIFPRTRGKRTGAWAWQYSALLYCESFVVQPGFAQIRSWLNRRDGLVTPLMAAPLTMSVMFMASWGRFSNKYVEGLFVVLGTQIIDDLLFPPSLRANP